MFCFRNQSNATKTFEIMLKVCSGFSYYFCSEQFWSAGGAKDFKTESKRSFVEVGRKNKNI